MLKWAMDLLTLIQTMIDKVNKAGYDNDYTLTGKVQRNPTHTIISHLKTCEMILESDPRFRPSQVRQFKSSWLMAVDWIKKEDPKFFDQFKDEHDAREELRKLLA